MFVIPPYLRFALIALGIIGGATLWAAYGFWYGFPFLLAGIILLIGYLILGTVGPAAKALQTQDFNRAEKLLNLTLSPKLLYSANRAFFYMLKGNIALSRRDFDTGEVYFKQAEEIGIPSANESAGLYLQLSQLEANRRRFTAAKQYLKKAKEAKPTMVQIKEQIAQVDALLKQSGQAKAAQRMGRQGHQMMNRGNKRRRPKNR